MDMQDDTIVSNGTARVLALEVVSFSNRKTDLIPVGTIEAMPIAVAFVAYGVL